MRHSYQLAARIEGGEVSEHYRGTQDRSREVCLKIHAPRLSDPEYGRALSEIARKIGGLGNPAILHYEDIGVAGGRLCCVRGNVDGFHLGTALMRLASKEVVLPSAVALQIAVEVMLAVGAVHEAGLAHGALTPANIFVTREGRVFVTDFLALSAMRKVSSLRALADRGRQAYRAPEVSKGSEEDAGADVYSIGAILYELLTLREVAGSRGGGVSTRRDALVPPSRLDRRVNARLDPLIMRALEPLKSRRHKNGLEMAESFRAYLSATGPVPGRPEILKFVNELFPNEVNLSGSTSDLPLRGAFELEPVSDGPSLPGLKLDVSERLSYSMPAIDISPDLATESGIDPPPPKRVSEWDAPPGTLDPAVVRKLSEPGRKPIEVSETQPLSREALDELRRPEPVENFVVAKGLTDVTTNPRPVSELIGDPEPTSTVKGPPPPDPEREVRETKIEKKIPGAERASKLRKALDDPRKPSKPEKPDWHVKYEPPPPKPKPTTPVGHWLLAMAMAAGAAALTFMAVSRHNQRVAQDAFRLAPPRSDPRPHTEPQATIKEPARTRHIEPKPVVVARPTTFCLSVEADLAPAVLRVDNGAPIPLPVTNLVVSPGDHELLLSAHGHVLHKRVSEAITRAPCVQQTVLLSRASAR